MKYVLGIDGGGTKTLAFLADMQGIVLGKGTAGSSNYQTVGISSALESIRESVNIAFEDSAIKPGTATAACIGLAGAGRDEDREILRPEIEKLILANRVILTHDAAIALAGATVGKPGVVVIAGTGAMAFGINKTGHEARANGWGNILGDEGSAYYIGRKALISACRAYDGRGRDTGLIKALIGYMKLNHFTDIVKKIYRNGYSTKEVADMAVMVGDLAKEGDKVSLEILRDAGRELATAAVAVIEKLGMKYYNFPVAMSGSVFNAGEALTETFSKTVKNFAADVEIIDSAFKPAMGAVFMALLSQNVDICKFRKNEKRSRMK
ncbi:hypothetical protein GF312_09085 [Candidatus Poribacteria bacterium]|nr:hypothetical protein [Candidatus Poribacteria bacterium]